MLDSSSGARVAFVSCTPACTDAGQEVVFTLDELAAGQTVDLGTPPDQLPNTGGGLAVMALGALAAAGALRRRS